MMSRYSIGNRQGKMLLSIAVGAACKRVQRCGSRDCMLSCLSEEQVPLGILGQIFVVLRRSMT